MSFSLPHFLNLTALDNTELNYIKEKCTDPETTLQQLTSDATLLETIVKHIPDTLNLEVLDRKFLLKVIKIAEEISNINWPSELVAKIKKLSFILFYQDPLNGLSSQISAYAKEFYSQKGIPSIFKIRNQIQEALITVYLHNPSIPFNQLLNWSTESIQSHFKNGWSKFVPNPKDLLSKIASTILDTELSGNITTTLSGLDTLPSLQNSLLDSQQQELKEILQNYFLQEIQNITTKLESINEQPDLPLHFQQKFNKVFVLFTRLNLTVQVKPPLLSEKINKLTSIVLKRFYECFEEVNASSAKQEDAPSPANLSMYALLDMLHVLQHNFKDIKEILNPCKIFELNTSQKILSKFDQDLCFAIGKSKNYNPWTRAILFSIAEFLLLLNNEKTFTLQDYTATCEKVYIKLVCHHKNLKRAGQNDLLCKIFLEILRGCFHKATKQCQTNCAETVIDLNIPGQLLLKKRLNMLLSSLSDLLESKVELRIEMKVKHDRLLAILYQLICLKYKTTPETLPSIVNWINAHSEYDFENFITWIKLKIKHKSKMSIKKDPEFLYEQFQNEHKK